MDGSPGCSAAEPWRPEESNPAPEWRAETLAGIGIPPALPRPSRAGAVSCELTRVSLRCTPDYDPPPPPGAETGVWPTIPSFATETN
jgi:hypothetical protein